MEINKKIRDYKFGKTDGATEVKISDYHIEDYFYEKDNYCEEINEDILLVLGRKGTGKTYIAKKMLEDMDYVHIYKFVYIRDKLEKLNLEYPNLTQWKALIYILLLESMIKEGIIKHEWDKNASLSCLPINGLDTTKKNLKKDSSAMVGMDLGVFKFEIKEEYKNSSETKDKMYWLYEFSDQFQSYIEKRRLEKKIILIFDEMDDLLNTVEGRRSLANFVECLHNMENSVAIPLIMLRDDVVFLDGARQKIRDDRSINIKWDIEELRKMLDKRLWANGIKWGSIFEEMIDVCISEKEKISISTWDYILKYTFYRPRDIVAFLIQCQKKCGNKTFINNDALRKIVKDYSRIYFFDTVADELNIYMNYNDIERTKRIFRYLFDKLCDFQGENKGKTKYWNMMAGFNYNNFYNVTLNWKEELQLEPIDIKALFLQLLSIGCIGQLKRAGNPHSDSLEWFFSYQDIPIDFTEEGRYILHSAIQRQYVDEYI